MKVPPLATLLSTFFLRYLAGERGVSPNTSTSYRDAIKLLLRFSATRHATGHVLPHYFRIRYWERRAFACVEGKREAQPLMQMLAYHLARVPQSQQTACNSVDTLFVWRRSIVFEIVTGEPVRKHREFLSWIEPGEESRYFTSRRYGKLWAAK